MRTLHTDRISEAVAELCLQANRSLNADMRQALRAAGDAERSALAARTLDRILENAAVAENASLPMCQDTGLVVVFAEVGQSLLLEGTSLQEAVDTGVRQGYTTGHLRASVSADPLDRGNTGDNTPAVVHASVVPGDGLRLRLLAKGGGCENMSDFRMLTPFHGTQGVADFAVETAVRAGPNACPPMVVGVGVGGSFEQSALLAKRSLLRELGVPSTLPHAAALEREVLDRLNASGIGPQGYGGDTTALAVHVELAACHVASLPVSVNIECHAHRHKEVAL